MRHSADRAYRLRLLLWIVLAACLAVQLAWPLATLPLHISSNNNEGWNAYWSARALAHLPIYTDRASAITNNYPPLSFYLVGYAGQALGDLVVAGRLVCLASLIACVVMVRAAIVRVGGDRTWATVGALSFLLYVATFAGRYVAADDPQWLAQALMLAGLLLLLEPTPTRARPGRIVAACLLMVIGGLIKHSQLALPIAATLWLLLCNRRGLIVWLATGVAATAVALAWLAWQFGPPLFEQVLHHQRLYQPGFLRVSLTALAPLLAEAVLAAMLLRSAWHRAADPRLLLLFLFAGLALVIGIAERAGQGVAQNAHFDAAEALLILAGVALARGGGVLDRRYGRLVAWGAMLLPMAVLTTVNAPKRASQLAGIGYTDAAWQRAIATLAAAPGPIACERAALCYWAGKPYAVDMFNYGQKLRISGDTAGFGRAIAERRFGGFVLHKDKRYLEGSARLPVSFYHLIEANYRTVQVLPDKLYVLTRRGD